jgi:2-dehydropantoate 2-reductase
VKVCIFGAGAIGGYMAAKLAHAGEAEVSVVARGPHLAAMQERGLVLRANGEEVVTHPRVASDPAELGPQDYVVITLKAHSVPAALPQIMPLVGERTAVVMGVNGVPWWYFFGLAGPYENRRLASIDPGDVQWQQITPQRVIGCVVYPAAEVPEPGVIELIEGDRFSLGEPDGSRSERVTKLSEALIKAGLKAPVRPKIRDEIWVKLWGNLSFNPISALTHATLEQIVGNEGTRLVARNMMLEAQAIAEKLGVKFPITVDKRIEGAGAVGAHKTSMLQDLERGRPMEIEALVGAVAELGRVTETPTPTIDTVLALIRLRAKTGSA